MARWGVTLMTEGQVLSAPGGVTREKRLVVGHVRAPSEGLLISPLESSIAIVHVDRRSGASLGRCQ